MAKTNSKAALPKRCTTTTSTPAGRVVMSDQHWVDVKSYITLRPGETLENVYRRRSKGIWINGVQSKFIKGEGLWVDLVAINTWASKSRAL